MVSWFLRYRHRSYQGSGRILCALALALLVPVGCKDSVKASEEQAILHAERLCAVTDTDVNEIRRGLPQGAKKLANTLSDADLLDSRAVRAQLRKTRDSLPDLQLAKSTFFAFTNPSGVVYASDQEGDAMATKNLLSAFPALGKVALGAAYGEARGDMPEARGVKKSDDLQWVAAAAVPGKDGGTKGLYATGWSLRFFAHHLEEQLKTDLRYQDPDKTHNLPLLYVFVVAGSKAYGNPVVPEVNQKAVEGLGVLSKLTGDRTWHSRIEITGREYGVAAHRAKNLGDDTAVVVLRSEI